MPLYDTERVDLGGDEWVDIREVSVSALKTADRKGTEDAVAVMGMMPDKVVEDQLNRTRDMAIERIVRFEGFDPETLLINGITGWSFREECTDETKLLLGARKGEIVARAIFKLSVTSLGEAEGSSPRSAEAESPGSSDEPTPSTPPEES